MHTNNTPRMNQAALWDICGGKIYSYICSDTINNDKEDYDMGKNDGALGLFPLDDVTIALLRGIMEMTPEEREELLALWKEMKRSDG